MPTRSTSSRAGWAAGFLGLGLAGLGLYALYRHRRDLYARALKLTPPRHAVSVTRDIAIGMADGVTLRADHYAPRGEGPFPTILVRSGYGRGHDVGFPMGPLTIFAAERIAERGYHCVVQTTRGRFDSEGAFRPFLDAAADGRDTLAWITRQPWYDQALGVGMYGGSWLGYVQWALAAGAPPELRALVPMIVTPTMRDIFMPEGVFSLETGLRWMVIIERILTKQEARKPMNPQALDKEVARVQLQLPVGTLDEALLGAPLPYFREFLTQADNPDGPLWKSGDFRAALPNITAPTHIISGWYDFMAPGALDAYSALRQAGRRPYLTVGPWTHLDPWWLGPCLAPCLDWYDAQLKGEVWRLRSKPVSLFVQGANEWRELDDWPPPARTVRYHLHPGGALHLRPAPDNVAPTTYRYDPHDPTPSLGGASFTPQAGPRDQRPIESRRDLLHFTTLPLECDLDVIGPVQAELFVHSTLDYTDFVARLCDVYPDGRALTVCDGIIRIAPGDGTCQPDGTLRVTIALWPTAQRFLRGHRLRLHVASAAHPRWARNPGTGEGLLTNTRLFIADQSVYHDAAHPSALVLPVVGDEPSA